MIKRKKSIYEKSAVISGTAGIVCNTVLSAAKLIVGTVSGSSAILTDGFNNLSDAAANAVTIIGAKMSRKPMDKEHPFGHGRIEYISALVIAFFIFTVSAELFKESLSKLLCPAPLSFSIIYIIVLCVSVAVKLCMALLNNKLFKLSGNVSLKAVRLDCLSDCLSTAAAIISLLLFRFFGIMWIDGAIGMAISAFIFFSGIIILKDIINPLIGQSPPREIIYRIEEQIISNDSVLDVSEIIVHSYGSGNSMASARAAVNADSDFVSVHSLIDKIEKRIKEELDISITIHVDPI